VNALYKAYHVGARLDAGYHEMDLITEILSGGHSSIMYHELVKEQKIFSQIDCYHMGNVDKGLVIIEGKVTEGIAIEDADKAVEQLLAQFLAQPVAADELQKAKNKTESIIAFEDLSLLNRANNLAFYELLGNASAIDTEWQKYDAVTVDDIMLEAKKIFDPNNCSTLYYVRKSA
jgi:zinc protease